MTIGFSTSIEIGESVIESTLATGDGQVSLIKRCLSSYVIERGRAL